MDLNLPEKRVFIGPANIWKRMLALVIDLLVLDFFVIGFFRDILMNIVGEPSSIMTTVLLLEQNAQAMRSITLIFMLMVMLAMAYFALLQYTIGQTVGGILLNINVVQQVSEKEFVRPNLWQCVTRNLFLIPAVPFIFLWIADPLYMIFAKKGQRLTEWLSQTKVVERYEM